MLIDMIHDNHGEPAFRTRYREAGVLKGMGYEGIVIPEGMAYMPAAYGEGERKPGVVGGVDPGVVEGEIDGRVKGALGLGMKVYFYGDAWLLPRHIVEREPGAFYCEDGSGRLCAGKPRVLEAFRDQVEELFDRWPGASGLVMRTGEVYPESTPHMVGSAVHASNCSVCRGIGLVERLVGFIGAMHEVVVAGLGKAYVHRAWMPAIAGLPNMHDDAGVYREVSGRVPEGVAFSFKFTRGDFLRARGFNPCLLADERRKWIEFQCEREFEGKGAFPNYQVPIWREFFERLSKGSGRSFAELRGRFDVWGWSRGGGWGGPYVQREEWIDANVAGLAGLYREADGNVQEMATRWVEGAFGVAGSSAATPAIVELLMMSAGVIRKLLYVGAAASAEPWLKDDLLDVNAIWGSAMQVLDLGKGEEAIGEKREAHEGAERVRHLFDLALPGLPNAGQGKALSNSLAYYSSFAGSVASLFVGFVRFGQWHRGGRKDGALAEEARDLLEHAQAHWQHHTQRHALLAGAPSVFQENTLWERTNGCLEELQGNDE
ncbi:MAG: hypothetical protein ACTHN5_16145 [Phycisphaerae bacterium]